MGTDPTIPAVTLTPDQIETLDRFAATRDITRAEALQHALDLLGEALAAGEAVETLRRGLIAGCVLLAVCLPTSPTVDAAPRATEPPVMLMTRDMSHADVDAEIRRAMPFPVVSIFSGVKDDKRHFAVNMRISGKSQPVFNVTWHVPIWPGRAHMLRGIAAAAAYARVAADRPE